MKRYFTTAILLATAVLAIGTGDSRRTFRANELIDGEILGMLGKPLGLVCKIEGTAIKHDGGSMADSDCPMFLNVKSIDGSALDKPILIRANHLLAKKDWPVDGQSFSYVVVESASFIGPQSDPHEYLGKHKRQVAFQTDDQNYQRYHLRIEMKIAKPE